MGIYRIAQGSPVVFFQEPRRFTIHLVAVNRRRRFIILIAICCLSLFIFGWYSRTSHSLLELRENSDPSNEILKSQRVAIGNDSPQYNLLPEEPQRKNKFMDFIENVQTPFRRYEEERVSG
ncbi:unnamed protein product, partial [Larinioides sclopetarius]